MGFSVAIRAALASALVLAPLSAARSQLYGDQDELVSSELDRIVRADATTWSTSYGYVGSSMRDGTVMQQTADGGTQLWRGFFRYTDGDAGEVRARIRNNRVECLVYDTSYMTSWCTLSGGGTNFLGVAVAGLVIAAVVGSSGQSQSSSSESYSDESTRYRQCMQSCANLAINEPNIYNAARQQCERRC